MGKYGGFPEAVVGLLFLYGQFSLAKSKNRNPWAWLMMFPFTAGISFFVLFFLPTLCPACKQPLSIQEWKQRKCPRCGDIAEGRTQAVPVQPAGPTMDAARLKELADLYQTWSTEQLVTAASEERRLYEPQAIELIDKELQRRNETMAA